MGSTFETLTVAEVVKINRRMLEAFGGFCNPDGSALLNPGSLEHVLEAICFPLFGVNRYPTLYKKAAALCCAIACGHIFTDANKRTALEAARLTLELNGQQLKITPELIDVIRKVAKKEMSEDELATWFSLNTRTIGYHCDCKK